MDEWWMGGEREEAKAGLRIAYNNLKILSGILQSIDISLGRFLENYAQL